jgi:hypothetical protein
MNTPARPSAVQGVACHHAALRVVPHVHTGAFVNVGVMLHARAADYLGIRVITDAAVLRRLVPDVDVELLAKYLRAYEQIAAGDAAAGEIALLPSSERFHWMTAPRSDVLQASPVHAGMTHDAEATLQQLYRALVAID